LINSTAPTTSSEKLMGAHTIERVTIPEAWSTPGAKFGSCAASKTVWQMFSRTLFPTMPSDTGSRAPVIERGPTEAWQVNAVPESSTTHKEPASAPTRDAIEVSAWSSVVSTQLDSEKPRAMSAMSAKALVLSVGS
jgi:hypothetical protein